MADKYTSLLALVLDGGVEDVSAVVRAATVAGDLDRTAPVGDGTEAHEVFWGGRMQRAVVRRVDHERGPLLRAETYIGADGLTQGMRRHAQLLVGLARQLPGKVTSVLDLSADVARDEAWLQRVAGGAIEADDVIVVHSEGEGTHWVHTHGGARLDLPDLELYGLNRSQVPGAEEVMRRAHEQLLRGGLRAELTLEDGTPVYLVPVLEAWPHLPLDWPGIGRAGKPREGHDGPRATLSVLHKPRFGHYRKDFKGVLATLAPSKR